jgi:hypothetical protein
MSGPVYWHGLTNTEAFSDVFEGEFHGDFVCITTDREVALSYAEGDEAKLYRVEVAPLDPLVIDTPEAFIELWNRMLESHAGAPATVFWGADGHFNRFCAMLKSRGHDFVDFREGAFEGDLGYEWVSGTIGDVQSTVLDKSIITAVLPAAAPAPRP